VQPGEGTRVVIAAGVAAAAALLMTHTRPGDAVAMDDSRYLGYGGLRASMSSRAGSSSGWSHRGELGRPVICWPTWSAR
jgi:cystathionine beta-lyase/cystathionine gamma-synthase